MSKLKLDKQFLKFCPRCKIFHPSVYKECPICRKALRSLFLKYYLGALFRRILFPLIVFFLCVYSTYGIQINERAQYKRGLQLLMNRKFGAGIQEISSALAKHPLPKAVKQLAGKIKGKGMKIKEDLCVLQAIFFDISSKSSALINNKIVFEGDNIGEIKVVKVNVDSVDIEINGKIENIKFGRIKSPSNKEDSLKIIKDDRKEEKLSYEKVINYYKQAQQSQSLSLE